MTRSIPPLLVLCTIALLTTDRVSGQASGAPIPSDDRIRSILVERIDTHRQSVGIVIGVIEPSGRRIVTYGHRAATDRRPVDGDTVFEIGSITKVFTALLLADAVTRNEVGLTDPVAKYLPQGVTVPEGGRQITLQDLATHTSGLPRLPDNLRPKHASNPYADYTVEQLYEFLTNYQLPREPGASYEYSNLGAGLLGHALARRAGVDYETLVKARITAPLGMASTGVTLSPILQAGLAVGHSRSLQPVENWDLPTLAGAGALRSTANDMLTFLAAVLAYVESPLAPAMTVTLEPRRSAGAGGVEIALGWHVRTMNGKTIVEHNGGTGGYRSYLGFDPDARTGVVVLANVSTPAGPDDIGRHLLDPARPLLSADSPLLAAPRVRTRAAIDNELFDRYVGRYQLAPAVILTVSRDGSRFLAQLTGQPAVEIFAESTTTFFLEVVDAQLTFETDADGKAIAVTLHQNMVTQRAPRIEGEPEMPADVQLDPQVLDFRGAGATPLFERTQWRPQTAIWKRTRHRAARRRRVRADGGLPDHRLRDQPAVRRRRTGGIRDRHAHHAGDVLSGRRAGLRRGARRGQNVGAGHGDGVRTTFALGASMAGLVILAAMVLCHLWPAAVVRVFSADPHVVAVGEEYLRILSWGFVASASCSWPRASSRHSAERCRPWPHPSYGCCSSPGPQSRSRA